MDVKEAARKELYRRQAAKELARRKSQAQDSPYQGNSISAASQGVDAGMMFGFDDEIGAGMMAPIHATGDFIRGKGFNVKDNYTRLQKELNDQKKARRKENPVASTVGEVAGGLGMGGAASKAGLTLAGKAIPKIGAVGNAAVEGAAYGAAYGAGEADPGTRTQGALQGGVIGGMGGAAFQKGANVVKNKLANKAAQKAAPTMDQQKAQASQLYEQMRSSGLKVREGKINNIKNNVALELKSTTPALAPKAHALSDLLERDLVGDVDIQDLHNASKAVNRISRTNLEGDDKYFVGKIKDYVDGAFDGMKASDYKGPIEAIKLKGQADDLWKTARKTEIIDDIFENAKSQATGFENGLVVQFRSLLKNKKKMKAFTPEERKMMEGLVRRGDARAILKGLGMLSPTSTFGGLMAGGVGVGSGILPAAAMAGTGYAARKGAEAITRNKANAIRQAVSTGSAPIQATSQSAARLAPTLAGQLEFQRKRRATERNPQYKGR